MPTTQLTYKVIEINILETSKLIYTFKCRVQFFYDEEMTKIENEKEYVFENIEYNPTWDWILWYIYNLIDWQL